MLCACRLVVALWMWLADEHLSFVCACGLLTNKPRAHETGSTPSSGSSPTLRPSVRGRQWLTSRGGATLRTTHSAMPSRAPLASSWLQASASWVSTPTSRCPRVCARTPRAHALTFLRNFSPTRIRNFMGAHVIVCWLAGAHVIVCLFACVERVYIKLCVCV